MFQRISLVLEAFFKTYFKHLNKKDIITIKTGGIGYGIFSVIFKGQLLKFHRLTIHSVIKKLRELTQ